MNAHHLLANLESRITELQDLSNDAYDIAAGTLMPGITDLAPPVTPQQEVFSGPSAPGQPGEPGKDGATWVPSLRPVTVTTPNPDNSGSTSHEEVYLDFTNSQTQEVVKGTVNLKGKDGKDGEKGEPGESSSGGSVNLPDAKEISFIASIEFKDGKLVATKGTLKVYAAEEVVLAEPVTLFETTPHSTQHTATSGGSGSEA